MKTQFLLSLLLHSSFVYTYTYMQKNSTQLNIEGPPAQSTRLLAVSPDRPLDVNFLTQQGYLPEEVQAARTLQRLSPQVIKEENEAALERATTHDDQAIARLNIAVAQIVMDGTSIKKDSVLQLLQIQNNKNIKPEICSCAALNIAFCHYQMGKQEIAKWYKKRSQGILK